MNKRTWWRVFGRPNRRDAPPQPDLIAGDARAKFAALKRLCDGPCPPMTEQERREFRRSWLRQAERDGR